MFDSSQYEALLAKDDPRVTKTSLRLLPATADFGAVLIISVAHDHPASIARVSQVLDTIGPDILALELPPLAMPLFRYYATEESTPPSLGGEMSMALQRVSNARSVGIDVPTWAYLRAIARHLRRSVNPWKTLPALTSDFFRAIGQALTCRVMEMLGRLSQRRFRCYTRLQYECTADDPPERQASHERAHISKQQAFLQAVEISEATKLIDSLREESMVNRLHALRSTGDVVVVLGAEHAENVHRDLQVMGTSSDKSSSAE